MRLLAAALLAPVLALAASADAAPARKPLYRDPVYDGAADVSIVYDRAARRWTMFYTNRRATLRLPDPKDVAWVHATPIGAATSPDGAAWTYRGIAGFPAQCTGETLWAPEVLYEAGTYHLWLTVAPGVFHRWGEPGAAARIVHLTSPDLRRWSCGETLDLGSERVIDASVAKLPQGGWRLWFKDERAGSRIFAADSPDLVHWTRRPEPVTDHAAEGPKVFRFAGAWWMVADAWKGLAVLRSDDALRWTEQPERLLEQPGSAPTDRGKGQHPDVVVSGDRAFLYYFVHQGAEPEAAADPAWAQRTVIQVAELKLKDGRLTADREAATDVALRAPAP